MRRILRAAFALSLVVSACTSDGPKAIEPQGSSVDTDPGGTSASSEDSDPESVDPALLVELPTDPDVRIGVLDNGLTYYIRFNDSPGGRAELRLAVDAGSVLEDESQSGSAHFLEHMMFNGTADYPANELISVLESFGPQLGPDVNAYTSLDETVYQLSVPTDDAAVLDEAMNVLVQWAAHATLATEDVEGERGVVVEEWRLRDQGLSGRIQVALRALLAGGTPYEGHDTIGRFESISEMDPQPLQDFYRDWYRPELMAVVVVGDIDVEEVETQIQARFGSLGSADDGPARPVTAIALSRQVEATTLADAEATTSSVEIMYVYDSTAPTATVGDLQARIARDMALDIIAERLSDDTLRGTVPFFGSSRFGYQPGRALGMDGFSVSADADKIDEAAEAVVTEVERSARFGFSPSEFDRVRDAYVSLNEQFLDSQDSRQDFEFAAEYVAHFLAGGQIASVDQSYNIYAEILDRLTAEDLEDALVTFLDAASPRLMAHGPDQPASAVPTDDELVAIYNRVLASVIDPRADDEAVVDRLMDAPAPVAPASMTEDPVYGFVRIEYANGANVFFWPTDIADNLVSFSASSFGGQSLVEVDDLTEITLGVEMIPNSGVGGLSALAVDRLLSDKIVELYPYVTGTKEGFEGSAATEDLEVLMQLIHLSFTAPQIDSVAVSTTLSEWRPVVESPEDVPLLLASIALQEEYYEPGDERHWVVPPLDEFNAFDPDRALELYKERFGNAGDFVFGFVGDAPIDTVVDLADRYIGTLPGNSVGESFIDHQPLPTGIKVRTVEAGQDDQGLVQFQFTNEYPNQDGESDIVADLLGQIVNNRLRDRIREELSASYAPSVFVDMQLEPDPYIETHVEVSGDPERLDEITAEVLADIADLKRNGPTADELATAQEQLFRDYELVNNPFLLERTIFFDEHAGRDLNELWQRYDTVYLVTGRQVRTMARVAFPEGSYIRVNLIPET